MIIYDNNPDNEPPFLVCMGREYKIEHLRTSTHF